MDWRKQAAGRQFRTLVPMPRRELIAACREVEVGRRNGQT